jgi:hypothetical protein
MQKAPDHVAKLWALGEVRRMCASDAPGSLAKAARFATAHHLVTPVSGAVVLESKEQYDAAGLKPVDDATASNVTPEPASLLALAAGVGAVALGWRHRNKAA